VPFSLYISTIFCRPVFDMIFIVVEYIVNGLMEYYITSMTKMSKLMAHIIFYTLSFNKSSLYRLLKLRPVLSFSTSINTGLPTSIREPYLR